MHSPRNGPTISQGVTAVYGAAVLTGALLVFQIQPIAGRFLLPVFGGGAAVWTTCMFFFQSMLLAGYAYAYWLTRSLRPTSQAATHGLLLVLSAMLMPPGFSIEDNAATGNPAALIWTILLTTLGFPFVVLAATAPLMQRWSSITQPERSPYRLYAVSNVGALLALLTYPVLVEPNLSLEGQTLAWSAGYAVFLLASLAACRVLWRRHEPVTAAAMNEGETSSRSWSAADAVLTVILSACGVVMLLAMTSQITQNVAPIPFLWILPLVVYLSTFIVCFGSDRWYDRPVWGSLFVVAACLLAILEFFGASATILVMVIASLLVLLCACMVCHGELYRLRPEPRHLARYYLLIAAGGALGGAFVSIVAPVVFERYWESLLGAYVIYLAFGVCIFRDMRRERSSPARKLPRQAQLDRWAGRLFAVGWTIGVLLYPVVVLLIERSLPRYDVVSTRNFYGVLKVRDLAGDGPPQRRLVDGTTIHGIQLLDPARRSEPLTYYSGPSGLGHVLNGLQGIDELRIGVVGLGVGTIAAYGRPGDTIRFYELNPAVVDLAFEHFSFLRDTPAAIDIVVGDGRISLERELRETGGRDYDLLVVDAFTSDAIPVHLLTKEAVRVYWSHLAPGGVLAIHVTNSYVDLVPVVAGVAAALGKHAVHLQSAATDEGTFTADWVMITESPMPAEGTPDGMTVTQLLPPPSAGVWTDDYSDLLRTLR